MRSVPLVDRKPAASSAEAEAFWMRLSRGQFASPYDLCIDRLDFTGFQAIGHGAMQAFQSAVCALYVLMQHKSDANYRDVSSHLLEMLEKAGWRMGDNHALHRLRGAQITREALIRANGVSEAFAFYGGATEIAPKLLEWHTKRWGKYRDSAVPDRGEEYGGSVLIHDDAGDSVLLIEWFHHAESHITLDIVFDDVFAAPAREFMQSEFIWRCAPLHYCSSSRHDDGIVIQIDKPIQGRDGVGMSLDAFEPAQSVIQRSREYSLPLFAAQFSFRHFCRFL